MLDRLEELFRRKQEEIVSTEFESFKDHYRETFLADGFVHSVRSDRLQRFGNPGEPTLAEVIEWTKAEFGPMCAAPNATWVYFSSNEYLFKSAEHAFHFKMRWG